MKTISAGLKTLLQSSEYINRCELLTITLQQGAGVYYYNNGQVDLPYNGQVYLAADGMANPSFKRGPVTTAIGTDTKTMDLVLYGSALTKIGGVLLSTFAKNKGFDQAIIEVDALPMATWGVTTNGTYNVWTGIAGDVKPDRTKVTIEVSSMLRLLQGAFPRNFALPTCNNTLYDSGCTLAKATYAVNGTCSGVGTSSLFDTNLTQANDYFDLGWMVFTSGANNGLVRTVKTYLNASGAVLLTYPLAAAPANGDTFTIYPGCDKTQATCTSKYNNLLNFRGFPWVPNPMTLLAGNAVAPTAPATGPATPTAGAGGTNASLKLK